MSRIVVDASVSIKWFLPEVHDAAAQRLLSGEHELIVPDLLFPEVGNILWKRFRAGEITENEADTILRSLAKLPMVVVSSWPTVILALSIACETGRTVYDCLYLAVAVQEKAQMATADARFYNALKNGPLGVYLKWIEDVEE